MKEPYTPTPVMNNKPTQADIDKASEVYLVKNAGNKPHNERIENTAQAIADAKAEGFKLATTPTDEMKAHFEGENEIYQSFEIDGEIHVLPLNFQTVKYVLDEIRDLKEQGE